MEWVRTFPSFNDLRVAVDDLLSNLSFGKKADAFERALCDVGAALGFACDRPDKEQNAGPDVLWAIADGEYLLIECKNEVATNRTDINKAECGQMNTSIAWFRSNYPGVTMHAMMIVPAGKLTAAAVFTERVIVMRVADLGRFTVNVRAFFAEFASADFKSLSKESTQQWLDRFSRAGIDTKAKSSGSIGSLSYRSDDMRVAPQSACPAGVQRKRPERRGSSQKLPIEQFKELESNAACEMPLGRQTVATSTSACCAESSQPSWPSASAWLRSSRKHRCCAAASWA